MTEYLEHLPTFGALFAGTAVHILKKVVERRQKDETFHLKDYLLKYPYQSLASLLMAFGAYFGLQATGDLTVSSAFLAGVSANSLAGAAPGSR